MKKLSLLLLFFLAVSVFSTDTNAQCTSYFQSFYNTSTGDVDFTALCSYDTTISPILFQWDFGDGYGGYGENISHHYSVPNAYLVCLILYVGNGAGCCQDTFCEQVDFAPAAVAQKSEWISGLAVSTAGEKVILFLTLAQKQQLRMSLVMMSGVTIPVRVSDAFMQGRNEIDLQLPDYPPGMYMIRLEDFSGNAVSKRFVIY